MTTRRGFLGAILAAGVAPAFVGSGVLMPVKKIIVPEFTVVDSFTEWHARQVAKAYVHGLRYGTGVATIPNWYYTD